MPNSTDHYLARRDYWTQQAEAGKDFDCKQKMANGSMRTFKYSSIKDRVDKQNCIADLALMESRAVGGRRKSRSRKSRSRKSRSRKSRRR